MPFKSKVRHNLTSIILQWQIIQHWLDFVQNYSHRDGLLLALLKFQISLQLGKIFSSDNEVSVYIMYSYMYWLLHWHPSKAEMSDKLTSHNIYEYFMNTGYLCACLKKISCQFEPKVRLICCQSKHYNTYLKLYTIKGSLGIYNITSHITKTVKLYLNLFYISQSFASL